MLHDSGFIQFIKEIGEKGKDYDLLAKRGDVLFSSRQNLADPVRSLPLES
jgi:hypothetical protein